MKKIILSLALAGAISTYNAQTPWLTTLNSGGGLRLGTSSSTSLDFYTNAHKNMSLGSDGVLQIPSLIPSSSDGGMIYVDASGNLRTIPTGPPVLIPNSACSTTWPWYQGGNYVPANNRIGTCSNDDFVLKSNNVESVFLKPNGYVGVGINNSSPGAALDVFDGSIASNSTHLKILGDASGSIASTGPMSLSASANMLLYSVNEMDFAFDNIGVGYSFNVYSANARFTVLSGGNIGAGTASPSERFHVAGGNARIDGHVGVNCAPTTNENIMVIDPGTAVIRAHTSSYGTAKLTASNDYGGYDFTVDNNGANNYIGSISSGNLNFISYKANGTNPQVWLGARPTTGPHTDFLLAVNGKMVAKSIYVTLTGTWADYVFDKDYSLPDLSDVEAYYKENKHLPEIPSAAEVQEKGIDVAEMNKLLLKKVEELTIYAVNQQKEMDAQRQELEQMKKALTDRK